MRYKFFVQRFPDVVQDRGRRTRGRIVAAATVLFADQSIGRVSVAQIARSAGVHPNQVTYYFRSKDALFVEVAFRQLLHGAVRLEAVGRRADSPETFRRTVTREALQLTAIPRLVEALVVVNNRPELSGISELGLSMLFRRSEDYLARLMSARGWVADRPVGQEVARFWSLVFGAALLRAGGVPVVDAAGLGG